MLPEMPLEMREALGLGINLFAGEAEGRFDGLLQDADRGEPSTTSPRELEA
jgi:hypothetical protein